MCCSKSSPRRRPWDPSGVGGLEGPGLCLRVIELIHGLRDTRELGTSLIKTIIFLHRHLLRVTHPPLWVLRILRLFPPVLVHGRGRDAGCAPKKHCSSPRKRLRRIRAPGSQYGLRDPPIIISWLSDIRHEKQSFHERGLLCLLSIVLVRWSRNLAQG